jgi:tRNA(Ile2) C34 agmatinyltransferase TiaS
MNICPYCTGELELLGKLGQTEHFRCRNCGMTCSESKNDATLREREERKARAVERAGS